jgi:hypothetical protein
MTGQPQRFTTTSFWASSFLVIAPRRTGMNPQAFIDGLIAGSTIGLGAIGLTLAYSILRFANFTHGDFLAWGAYLP